MSDLKETKAEKFSRLNEGKSDQEVGDFILSTLKANSQHLREVELNYFSFKILQMIRDFERRPKPSDPKIISSPQSHDQNCYEQIHKIKETIKKEVRTEHSEGLFYTDKVLKKLIGWLTSKGEKEQDIIRIFNLIDDYPTPSQHKLPESKPMGKEKYHVDFCFELAIFLIRTVNDNESMSNGKASKIVCDIVNRYKLSKDKINQDSFNAQLGRYLNENPIRTRGQAALNTWLST